MTQIGSITLRNSVALAPMSGLSDVPFRTIAWSQGAGYVVSEMLSSKMELWGTQKSRRRRERVADVFPNTVQLAGSIPSQLAESARRHVDEGAHIIDLNFGCPAKKVCRRAAGSALLGDERLVGDIVRTVANAVEVPVTVKMRTGIAPDQKNAIRIAQIAQAEGAAALFLHGRTRACRFTGHAEYATARALKNAIAIPVFVNGDIDSVRKAQEVLSYTGADGLMIGRSAIGAPWLLGMINGLVEPERHEKWSLIRRHLELMYEFYGVELGVRIVRKHVSAYLRNLTLDQHRSSFNQLQTRSAQLALLARLAATDGRYF